MEEKKMEGINDDDGIDEFFGGDGGEEDDEPGGDDTLAARELAALTARLTTLGYQDGVDDGVQEVVQQGFDEGYIEGAAAGWKVGILYGAVAATAAALAQASRSSAIRGGDRGGRGEGSQKEDEWNDGAVVVGHHSVNNTEVSVVRGADCGDRQLTTEGTAAGAGDEEHALRASAEEGSGRNFELSDLADELRRSSLLGPDAPQLEKEFVFGRLRMAGSAGAAVAAAVGE